MEGSVEPRRHLPAPEEEVVVDGPSPCFRSEIVLASR
jgi:hypothetical protein